MAKHQRYTASNYYDTEPLRNIETDIEVSSESGYDTIEDVFKWCVENDVCISHVLVTEWDLDNIDEYGIPDIIQFNNLDALVAEDKQLFEFGLQLYKNI